MIVAFSKHFFGRGFRVQLFKPKRYQILVTANARPDIILQKEGAKQ
jgi:hypothetical protein